MIDHILCHMGTPTEPSVRFECTHCGQSEGRAFEDAREGERFAQANLGPFFRKHEKCKAKAVPT